MDYKIIHQPENLRFITEVDGKLAEVEYVVEDNRYLDITHTFVPQALEGQGIASALVNAAYRYALENELKPKATCPYAVTWLKRHPEMLAESEEDK